MAVLLVVILAVVGGGGAGAGIGGDGGTGGNANTSFGGGRTNDKYGIRQSGDYGGNGQNCGLVKINDKVKVYAYGGAGGGSATTGNIDSGAGGGGYPAAGIGGGGAGGGGGDHACSAGGFTAGLGEGGIVPGENGKGSTDNGTGNQDNIGIGGGYYTYSTAKSTRDGDYESWFGEGGCWYMGWSTAGSGGIAGKGGKIMKSEGSEIHAYNGDRITNGKYDQKYYEYDKDGNETTEELQIVKREGDGKEFYPAKIFAQSGVRRAVYDNDIYITDARKAEFPITQTIIKNKTTNVKNIQILPEANISFYFQGIGSGAGYIELSNGEFGSIE